MNTKIKEAKQNLINLMCEEAKQIINNSKKTNYMCSVGWVDYLHGKNAIQHIFKGAYITNTGRVLMVESNDSEASVNIHLDQVNDVEKIEWVLKGLKENNERLNELA
jgi:hypothetical protein